MMFVYREEPGRLRSRRILAVEKNKEGETGRVPLLFNGETQTFRVDTNGLIKSKREEPECKQQAFYELPGSEPLPWEDEYDHIGAAPNQ